MSTTSTTLMTAEELLRLPRGRFRAELINGELRTMPLAGHPHGRITMRIAAPLAQFVWENGLGEVYGAETGFKLASNPDTVLGPDVAFISRQRVAEVGETKGYWPGPPDLAVEVLSPGDRPIEVKTKVSQWLGFGSKQVWIVDPKHRTVTVYRSLTDFKSFAEEQDLEAEDLLPGFKVTVASLFKV